MLGIDWMLCVNKECRHPFIPVKRQMFCSVACSQKLRTVKWRDNNREHFKAQRRGYAKNKRDA